MFNLLNNLYLLKLDADKKIQEKHKNKLKTRITQYLDLNHLNVNTQLQIQPYQQCPTKKTDKKIIKHNNRTSTKQTSNQKRKKKKKKKTLKTPQKRITKTKQKKFKHNDRKA